MIRSNIDQLARASVPAGAHPRRIPLRWRTSCALRIDCVLVRAERRYTAGVALALLSAAGFAAALLAFV